MKEFMKNKRIEFFAVSMLSILLGFILAHLISITYAGYEYSRFGVIDRFNAHNNNNPIVVIWDDVEKTNCYVAWRGGVSCVRSKNY